MDGVQDTLVYVRHKTMSQRSSLFAGNNGHLFLKKTREISEYTCCLALNHNNFHGTFSSILFSC